MYSFDRTDVLNRVRAYAVAGWLTSDDGPVFSSGALPTYLDDIDAWNQEVHHHLRNDDRVYGRLSQKLWEDEWVE